MESHLQALEITHAITLVRRHIEAVTARTISGTLH